jgi:hypothetical protein
MEDVMNKERQREFPQTDDLRRDIERAIDALPVDPVWLARYFLTPRPIRRARLVIALARTVAAAAGAAGGPIDVERYSRLAARLLMKRLRSGAVEPGATAVVTMDYTP